MTHLTFLLTFFFFIKPIFLASVDTSQFYSPVQLQPFRHFLKRPVIIIGHQCNEIAKFILTHPNECLPYSTITPDTTLTKKIFKAKVYRISNADFQTKLENGEYFSCTSIIDEENKEEGVLGYSWTQMQQENT
eukprot:Awhi_evm1s8997